MFLCDKTDACNPSSQCIQLLPSTRPTVFLLHLSTYLICSYMRTKGEVEQAVQALEFPSCFICRPGLLNRGASKRLVEKVGSSLHLQRSPPLRTSFARQFFVYEMSPARRPVAVVARAMVTSDMRSSSSSNPSCRVMVLSNRDI
jgi:hypothetical protein